MAHRGRPPRQSQVYRQKTMGCSITSPITSSQVRSEASKLNHRPNFWLRVNGRIRQRAAGRLRSRHPFHRTYRVSEASAAETSRKGTLILSAWKEEVFTAAAMPATPRSTFRELLATKMAQTPWIVAPTSEAAESTVGSLASRLVGLSARRSIAFCVVVKGTPRVRCARSLKVTKAGQISRFSQGAPHNL